MFESLPDPLLIIAGLTILALAPFIAIMVTSYVKLVVVFSLVRNALGIQQIPPNMVLNGMAVILTLFIMAPLASDVYDQVQGADFADRSAENMLAIGGQAKAPFKDFLLKHCHNDVRVFFLKAARQLWPPEKAQAINDESLVILIPSFAVSELTSAFEIGFLLYLPFIAIDLIISNILLAMGMMMVSPMTISLPFKLLLFVLLDGWQTLIYGLIMTYN
jgi:type III secretion protein R